MARLPRLVRLPDGMTMLERMQIRDDREALAGFFDGLSIRSRSLRFFTGARGLPPRMLDALAAVDEDQHVAILALHEGTVVGDARYIRSVSDPERAEFAITVTDAFQRRGIGRMLLDDLRVHAVTRGIEFFTFDLLAENRAMGALARNLGAEPCRRPGPSVESVTVPLTPHRPDDGDGEARLCGVDE